MGCDLQKQIQQASTVLKNGGVVAYPTEYCFGLGCDPQNKAAVERILMIKQRDAAQGLLLIAADIEQAAVYAQFDLLADTQPVFDSWPGPTTWLLPKRETVASWICGQHDSVAIRVTSHDIAKQLCGEFAGAIVSTSANRHAQTALLSAQTVRQQMAGELDFIIDGEVGGAKQPSQIRHAITGEQLR